MEEPALRSVSLQAFGTAVPVALPEFATKLSGPQSSRIQSGSKIRIRILFESFNLSNKDLFQVLDISLYLLKAAFTLSQ